MRKKRINLTRFHYSRLMVRNNRVMQNWKRKLLKNWVNIEFD
jgi:hypothetical protein